MAQHRVDYLTPVQESLLGIIRRHIADTGRAPTVAELRAETGRSAGGIHYQLGELEAKGAIAREARRTRGIRLT